jgi:hypothetical protein
MLLCFEGIEYNETSFPIVKLVSTRFIQIVVFYYWQSLAPAYDVKMTIVNRDLDKEIYMDEYKKVHYLRNKKLVRTNWSWKPLWFETIFYSRLGLKSVLLRNFL